MQAFTDALTLQAGYNAAVVCLGAAALGAGAGAIGVFILLRKRALVSDAISHATLPGLCLGFLTAFWLTGDGRQLPYLLTGAALTGALGVMLVQGIVRNTRLTEDVAIGTVLSTFFAAGIVMLTIIQTLSTGGQAGLSRFLLGSAASMRAGEAQLIAIAAAACSVAILLLLKEFTLVCFDPEYAAASGYRVSAVDLTMIGLLLAVIVIGLTTVGLVLIIALAIIPPVAARFWTERVSTMVVVAALIGAVGSYIGAALSASAPNLPTGGVIVLVLFGAFVVSMLVSPVRGLLAQIVRQIAFQHVVHQRQGLLALARREPIFDRLTLRVLRRLGYVRPDGSMTEAGQAAAALAAHDQALWAQYATEQPDAKWLDGWSLRPIETVLPRDVVAGLEARIRLHAVMPAKTAGEDARR